MKICAISSQKTLINGRWRFKPLLPSYCDVDSYFKNQSGEQISDPRQYLFVITGSPILGGQERWEPRVSVKEEIVGMSA